MKILFFSISPIPDAAAHTVSLDLLHELVREGHEVHIVCGLERRLNQETYLSEEAGCRVLRVKIGNNKKANLLEKGLTALTLPDRYIRAIGRYFSGVRFDLVLYPTPPITHLRTVEYIKKRDGAYSYLLLRDIFPQNAVDIGLMKKTGPKSAVYQYFRRMEKKLYAVSDTIGCMSRANVEYLLRHNPELEPGKVEICPNSCRVADMAITREERVRLRERYGIPVDKKVFVYGGNLGRPQGIPFLIECLREARALEQAFFLVVGDGTEYKKLEAFVQAEKPQHVRLIKRLPKEEYDRLVAACDVGLIFLDHRFTIPNFPSRLLSYLQAGLPVLACTDPHTDIGKVIVEGGFGWWCESNDARRFAALVGSVGEDSGKMGEKGYAYLKEHYCAEKACRTILSHFA